VLPDRRAIPGALCRAIPGALCRAIPGALCRALGLGAPDHAEFFRAYRGKARHSRAGYAGSPAVTADLK
jgi:hypothetical protein